MANILVIDDDIFEQKIVNRSLTKIIGEDNFRLQHAHKCSEAIDLLLQNTFDLVLLDNLLAESVSGKFSVPIIKQYLRESPLVIMSNNTNVDYLEDPKILGVDDIIEKSDLSHFLKAFFSHRVVGQNASSAKISERAG